ncbi:uncharacterized protein KGF55_004794 [Candida pseudojiufengensis]|uniref:uncharacterized protein n=1 Tax=Candida pseudojiufengensis TaxID=497109 RepID=UPI002224E37E|nr:uncharacterized protein KGF55_004794 [Candida pseudojiufengensis]KAI5960071.1 hypothetical protein KGF55_004794 [Candida pseudojiufengensis]
MSCNTPPPPLTDEDIEEIVAKNQMKKDILFDIIKSKKDQIEELIKFLPKITNNNNNNKSKNDKQMDGMYFPHYQLINFESLSKSNLFIFSKNIANLTGLNYPFIFQNNFISLFQEVGENSLRQIKMVIETKKHLHLHSNGRVCAIINEKFGDAKIENLNLISNKMIDEDSKSRTIDFDIIYQNHVIKIINIYFPNKNTDNIRLTQIKTLREELKKYDTLKIFTGDKNLDLESINKSLNSEIKELKSIAAENQFENLSCLVNQDETIVTNFNSHSYQPDLFWVSKYLYNSIGYIEFGFDKNSSHSFNRYYFTNVNGPLINLSNNTENEEILRERNRKAGEKNNLKTKIKKLKDVNDKSLNSLKKYEKDKNEINKNNENSDLQIQLQNLNSKIDLTKRSLNAYSLQLPELENDFKTLSDEKQNLIDKLRSGFNKAVISKLEYLLIQSLNLNTVNASLSKLFDNSIHSSNKRKYESMKDESNKVDQLSPLEGHTSTDNKTDAIDVETNTTSKKMKKNLKRNIKYQQITTFHDESVSDSDSSTDSFNFTNSKPSLTSSTGSNNLEVSNSNRINIKPRSIKKVSLFDSDSDSDLEKQTGLGVDQVAVTGSIKTSEVSNKIQMKRNQKFEQVTTFNDKSDSDSDSSIDVVDSARSNLNSNASSNLSNKSNNLEVSNSNKVSIKPKPTKKISLFDSDSDSDSNTNTNTNTSTNASTNTNTNTNTDSDSGSTLEGLNTVHPKQIKEDSRDNFSSSTNASSSEFFKEDLDIFDEERVDEGFDSNQGIQLYILIYIMKRYHLEKTQIGVTRLRNIINDLEKLDIYAKNLFTENKLFRTLKNLKKSQSVNFDKDDFKMTFKEEFIDTKLIKRKEGDINVSSGGSTFFVHEIVNIVRLFNKVGCNFRSISKTLNKLYATKRFDANGIQKQLESLINTNQVINSTDEQETNLVRIEALRFTRKFLGNAIINVNPEDEEYELLNIDSITKTKIFPVLDVNYEIDPILPIEGIFEKIHKKIPNRVKLHKDVVAHVNSQIHNKVEPRRYKWKGFPMTDGLTQHALRSLWGRIKQFHYKFDPEKGLYVERDAEEVYGLIRESRLSRNKETALVEGEFEWSQEFEVLLLKSIDQHKKVDGTPDFPMIRQLYFKELKLSQIRAKYRRLCLKHGDLSCDEISIIYEMMSQYLASPGEFQIRRNTSIFGLITDQIKKKLNILRLPRTAEQWWLNCGLMIYNFREEDE